MYQLNYKLSNESRERSIKFKEAKFNKTIYSGGKPIKVIITVNAALSRKVREAKNRAAKS